MDGILIVDKPAGMTSHDVVAKARRILGERRVGHAGTLDPDATGVLVLGLGRATRLLRFLEPSEKEYVADVIFGIATTTQDGSGEPIAELDASAVGRDDVEREAKTFVGVIEQIPPMVSAVKVGGERLYKKARRGEEVERPSRQVTIHALRVEAFEGGARARARVRIRCSAGTYIRTLANDLGRALGVGAHVAALRRVRVGAFTEDVASTLDLLTADRARPMLDALAEMPHRTVDADAARALAQGKSLPAFGIPGPHAVVGPRGLVAVAEDRDGETRPLVVVSDP